ncbi:hypothetical protein SETIT_2G251200v2 [Setaria italica]|uniref:Uncharacterized protein n=2 Tax=Setaria italica TaxID=4555 RepID=A0A368Q3E8_SETIT|nr:hypothetical protein SETIT_2G251200v2 [Setaria italica]RCV12209.1 hypothetical protein SETIT_2G251200v2 [Setaria italica]
MFKGTGTLGVLEIHHFGYLPSRSSWQRINRRGVFLGGSPFDSTVYEGMAGGSAGKDTVDGITKRISALQKESSRLYGFRTAVKEVNEKKQVYLETVGGFIQGFRFSYEEGDKISHGSLILESRSDELIEHEATFLLLPKDQDGKGAAERIFQSTHKVKGSAAIASAHLIAECEELDTWIVCYEKLECLLQHKDLPPFYEQNNEISGYWKNQLRAIITTLSDMGIRDLYHGGMANSASYAIQSSMNIKLIGISKEPNDKKKFFFNDLEDFDKFLCGAAYINASSGCDWQGFSYLINSHAMCQKYTWAQAVLNHPILLDPALRIQSYIALYEWADSLPFGVLKKFCNDLYCLMPQYYGDNLWNLIKKCPACCQIYSNGTYTGFIYKNIIKFVRNMIDHGHADFAAINNGSWTDMDLYNKINDLFAGFMSLAYSVSKATAKDRDLLRKGVQRLPY